MGLISYIMQSLSRVVCELAADTRDPHPNALHAQRWLQQRGDGHAAKRAISREIPEQTWIKPGHAGSQGTGATIRHRHPLTLVGGPNLS